jgi:hypothetical protein
MRRVTTIAIAGLAAAALVGGFATMAVASNRDDAERPISAADLERATTVALTHVGSGRVTETEAADEDAAFEVEVTKDDGTEVDVHLDASFNVVVPPDEVGPDDDADEPADVNEPDDDADEPADANEPDDDADDSQEGDDD